MKEQEQDGLSLKVGGVMNAFSSQGVEFQPNVFGRHLAMLQEMKVEGKQDRKSVV
jgi:hypothetical protein